MANEKIYDVIGIGIGPFNLGMAALLEDRDEIDALFFDQTPYFNWHPGMLIEGADLQVPFLADLVTFADPTSRFSFLNYLHTKNRLYTFYFFNRFDIPRREYNDYAQWVADQLSVCRFGYEVTDVKDAGEGKECYEITVQEIEEGWTSTYYAKHIVIGTGGEPLIPQHLSDLPREDVIHTSRYQHYKEPLTETDRVVVTGSGQSAAEVVYNLLSEQERRKPYLYWITRSPGFFQLEAGKLGQEVFSPDYIDYFHQLPYEQREKELPNLSQLRKGVEEQTLHSIYDLLYHRTVDYSDPGIVIQANTELKNIEKLNGDYEVTCYQHQEEHEFSIKADKVILATGYKPCLPEWLSKFEDQIKWDDKGMYAVTRDYRLVFKDSRNHNIFTLTNLEHSHGAGATNLALSVQRNVKIINRIAGRKLYEEQRDTVFQSFSTSQFKEKDS